MTGYQGMLFEEEGRDRKRHLLSLQYLLEKLNITYIYFTSDFNERLKNEKLLVSYLFYCF